VETFVDDFGSLPVFCFTEVFFSTFLLPLTFDDLRTFSVPRVTEESVVFLVTLVPEDLSEPERVLSIDLLLADFEVLPLRSSTETLFRDLAFFPEFVLE
jgi:hypothetical protein